MPHPHDFRDLLLNFVLPVIDSVTSLLILAAFLSFFWGLTQFIYQTGTGNKSAIQTGKNLMIWGTIAIFVMMSVTGILHFLYTDFGFTSVKSFGFPFFSHLQE